MTGFDPVIFPKTRLYRRKLSDLTGDKLNLACLFRTNLSDGDLCDAYLWREILDEVNLDGTNLQGASLRDADLNNVDIREAVWLDTRMADGQFCELSK